ncbi:MAG: putative RND superfamily exporter protein, partial [Candidatus Paceibacteria bacterium]
MRISNALATWARGLHEHPRLGMLGVLLVSLGAAFGITRFEIDPDVSALLPNDSEEVALFKATNLGESSSRTLYLLVEGDELSTRLGPFVERLQASPFLTRITATRAEFGGEFARQAAQAPLWYLSETSLDELESRLQAPGRRLAIKESKDLLISDPLMGREVVKSDPLGLRWVLSQAADVALPSAFEATSPYLLLANGTQAFIRIEGRKSSYDVDFSERLLADIEARGEGLELLEVGGYAIAREDSRRIRGDLTSSLQWSIPLLLLFFLFSTRSLVLPQLYLLPTALAVFWTLGYGGLILGPMTPLAVSAAAILCGLGVDFSIHYLGRYREESESLEPLEALEATQRATGRSLIGCWLTSSVAFLSLAFGAFDGLRSLGMLLALGLTLTLLSTWTVLPLLLHRVPVFPKSGTPGPVPRLFARMAHSPLATVISVLIILAAGSGWLNSVRRGVPVDADPSLLRPADSTLARAVVKLEQALGFAPEGVTLLLDHATSAARLVDAGRALQDSEKVAFTDADQLTVLSTERVERVQAFRENTNEWVQGAMEDLQAAGLRPESLRA